MSQNKIIYERNPAPGKLEVQGVYDWPIWKKEASKFPWTYTRTEVCYFLRGRVIVIPDGGEPQEFRRGDYVTFPAGMNCTWEILEDVEKHYTFE